MAKARYRDGCPMTTVLLELAPADAAVTAACRMPRALRNKLLTDHLVAARI
jgi:TetR/AcrR family transcriptional regulator, lmrAB and yxaGH operons repressor